MAAVELVAGEKIKGESKLAIIACNDYLRMGPGRSLRNLLVEYDKGARSITPTTSLGTLGKWSTAYGWQERAELYDAAIEAEKTAAEKARQQAIAQRRKEVMESGPALDFERVDKLRNLLAVIEEQIFYSPGGGGEGDDEPEESAAARILRAILGKFDPDDPRGKYPNVWARDVKSVGKGDLAQTYDIIRFNGPLLAEYRAILDDIAKETGGRRTRTITENIDYGKLTEEQLQRVAAGEDPIQVILSDYASRQG